MIIEKCPHCQTQHVQASDEFVTTLEKNSNEVKGAYRAMLRELARLLR